MKNIVITILLLISFSVSANNKYKLDIEKLDVAYANAEEVAFDAFTYDNDTINQSSINSTNKKAWTAFALSLTFYFTGWAGLHRVYLDAGAGVFLAYFCTGGGFGILQAVDTIILFIAAAEKDGDISPYLGNKNLFMW